MFYAFKMSGRNGPGLITIPVRSNASWIGDVALAAVGDQLVTIFRIDATTANADPHIFKLHTPVYREFVAEIVPGPNGEPSIEQTTTEDMSTTTALLVIASKH